MFGRGNGNWHKSLLCPLFISDDLSSDEGEEKIYDDSEYPLFNTEDVQRYGEAYARYKARVLADESNVTNKSLVHCSTIKEIDSDG